LLEGHLPRTVAAILALRNVATLAGGIWSGLPGSQGLPWTAVPAASSLRWRRPARHVLAAETAPAGQLRPVAQVLPALEAPPRATPALPALQEPPAAAGDTASHRIAQLTRLVDLLEARRTQVFAPIALVLIWGTQLACAVEAWRRRSGRWLGEWVAVAG